MSFSKRVLDFFNPPLISPVQKPEIHSSDFFQDAMKYTLVDEGGYTNDPNDSGGPTNFGITQGDLSIYLGHSASVQEVKNMTEALAGYVYLKLYWIPLNLYQITHREIAIAVFNMSVNLGLYGGVKLAQQALCDLNKACDLDGHMGPKTVLLLNSVAPKDFIIEYAKLINIKYNLIASNRPTQKVFLKGWLNRSNRLLTLV